MAHPSSCVGWTPARIKLTRRFAAVVAVLAVALVWAMYLPWIGLTISTTEPTCAATGQISSVAWQNENGEVVQVAQVGCISAYHSVQTTGVGDVTPIAAAPVGALSADRSLQQAEMAAVTAEQPHGAPTPKAYAGLPAQTFWALGIAFLVVLSLLVRNAFGFIPAVMLVKYSYGAFVAHRTALGWGMEGMAKEMSGVAVHQWAFVGLLAVSFAAALLLLKVNAEQRKLDGKPHPLVQMLNVVASFVLRTTTDKLKDVAAAAKTPKGSAS